MTLNTRNNSLIIFFSRNIVNDNLQYIHTYVFIHIYTFENNQRPEDRAYTRVGDAFNDNLRYTRSHFLPTVPNLTRTPTYPYTDAHSLTHIYI